MEATPPSERPSSAVRVCRVTGCAEELGAEKPYFQKMRICHMHYTAESMLHDGDYHRFCQQCNRLEPLDLFSGNRRSCQAKLRRHNTQLKRRRQGKVGRGYRMATLPRVTAGTAVLQNALVGA